MDSQSKELIKKTIGELLEKAGFSGQIEISENAEDDSIVCNIATESDSNFLIGLRGVNLQAFQHLARLMVRKLVSEKIRFILDVNNYRLQKNQSVIEQALACAQQALAEQRAVAMAPMTTYERRIAHMELSKDSRVKTESKGEGENRKIIVSPADLID